MKTIEDLLREKFRHGDGLVVPTRDAMLGRVGRARRRRLVVAGAGLAAVVATMSVVLASVISGGLGRTVFSASAPEELYAAHVINAIFTDSQHGYVVQELCTMDNPGTVPDGAPTPDVHRLCSAQLLATADGGETWHTRSLPGEPAIKDAGVVLIEGHSLMFWVDDDGRLALGGWNRVYWTTADGGVTWTESAAPRDVGPVGSFGALGPDDRLTFLHSSPPEAISDKLRLVAASDGSFWLPCSVGNCVHVTRNHGSSWQTLATVDSATGVRWVATPDGDTVYASVSSGDGYRLVRSTDGGESWSVVLDLPWPGWSDLALPNGDLMLVRSSAEGGVFRLPAGASQLVPVTGAPTHPLLYRTGGVMVAAMQTDEPDVSVAAISTDGGATWISVPAPA